MIPNIGPLEIAIVLIIALLVFGPKRLPSLGRSLGRGITEFKDGLQSIGDDPDEEDEDEEDADGKTTTAKPALGPGESSEIPSGGEPEVTEVTRNGSAAGNKPAGSAGGEASDRRV